VFDFHGIERIRRRIRGVQQRDESREQKAEPKAVHVEIAVALAAYA
jgi:hypothetical protein